MKTLEDAWAPALTGQLVKEGGPIVATAIHDGHRMSADLLEITGITDDGRLREEDPHTGAWASRVSTHFIGTFSRFEFDLNRPREKAVYRCPQDAWGLPVWKCPLPDPLLQRSLERYDLTYRALHDLYRSLEKEYGAFVVLDLHSYNGRRGGPEAPPEPEETHPQINIGTESINRQRWGGLLDRFIDDLRTCSVGGKRLNVQENIIFKGGHHARWAHAHFPRSACVIAVEIKKFFMNEWTGALNLECHGEVSEALLATLPGLQDEIEARTK